MAAADKFGVALEAVRAAVRDRAFGPGEPLLVETLARRLRLSATPIREAMAFLAGAGIAERRGRGYRVRRLEPADVIELYGLHHLYVRHGLEHRRGLSQSLTMEFAGPNASEPIPAESYRQRVERFWSALVSSDRRTRLRSALENVSDQLALVRLVEPCVFPDLESELAHLGRYAAAFDTKALLAAVESYHARRVEAAGQLSAEAHWLPGRREI